MAIHKTDAVVLERRDYRETSYIVNFFTADFGKISAQVKGANRKAGKYGTSFQPLSYNTIVFYEKNRSDLHIISQGDLLENFNNIEKDIERFTYAAYFLELVKSAMPYEEKNSEVFKLLIDFLHYLDKAENANNIAQIFEVKFLKLSGFKPQFDSCVRCNGHVDKKSKFSLIMGGLLCPSCFSVDLTARSVMQGTIASINHIESIEFRQIPKFKMVPRVNVELSKMLRNFIDFHLGQQFKSLEFLKKVKLANLEH